jgi:hypothetical protein
MLRSLVLYFSVVCLLASPCLTLADLVNPGFETGDLTGWTVVMDTPPLDAATVVTTFAGQTRTYSAPYGNNFLRLQGWWDATIYQNVLLSAGQQLTGMAAVDLPTDFGSLGLPLGAARIFDSGGNELFPYPWILTSSQISPNTSSPWQAWTWTAPYAGSFRFQYTSFGRFTNGTVNALFDMEVGEAPDPTVPEPGSLALMGLGLPMAGLWLRKRRSAQS